MLSYQAELLAQLAERLDRRARMVPWVYTGLGAGAGLGAGFFASVFLMPGSGPWVIVVAAAALGALGYVIAQPFAVSMRLGAQAALCQKQIEERTRSR